jgi:hypothetical protein
MTRPAAMASGYGVNKTPIRAIEVNFCYPTGNRARRSAK